MVLQQVPMNAYSVSTPYNIGVIPINSTLTQFQTQGIPTSHYVTPPIRCYENRENSNCQEYNVPNCPRYMAEVVFHVPTFSNPPTSTQTATVNNTINLPASPQKWSDLETLVEVASNKVETAKTD